MIACISVSGGLLKRQQLLLAAAYFFNNAPANLYKIVVQDPSGTMKVLTKG